MIEIDDVTMSYGREPVVRNVSLTLPGSGITALIGPNGAGKSTLLTGIGRLMPLVSGAVRVDGIDVNKWEASALARRIAILRQENHLTMRLTVAELVMLGRHPHTRGRATADDEEKVSEALRSVAMLDLADRFLDQLSGGQRQRAFVAMTLAQEAGFLLLDEPLSSLDMRHARDMMRNLTNISLTRGIGVVVVIHDVNTASAYADRIIAMADGRVVADGPPEDVMRPEVLSSVFDVDVVVSRVGGRPVAFPVT